MLRTNRGLLKFLLLSIVSLGIYGIVVFYNISREINMVATPRDGKQTMNFLLVFFIFSWLTLGIVPIVWQHKISNRIGRELAARNLPYCISAWTFWEWYFLGMVLLGFVHLGEAFYLPP